MWIACARIRGTTQPISALAVEDLLWNPDDEPVDFYRSSSGRGEKIRSTLKAEVEEDLISGISLEIGCLENQLADFDPLKLRGFQIDLCIEAAVIHRVIIAGTFQKLTNPGSTLDRTRVKPP
jgi:hypothetical protein